MFCSARGGGYLTLGQARYTFGKATAAVDGFGGVRLHNLRHTCASLAISSGANVKAVQLLLGHRTAVLTLEPTWAPIARRSGRGGECFRRGG